MTRFGDHQFIIEFGKFRIVYLFPKHLKTFTASRLNKRIHKQLFCKLLLAASAFPETEHDRDVKALAKDFRHILPLVGFNKSLVAHAVDFQLGLETLPAWPVFDISEMPQAGQAGVEQNDTFNAFRV